MLYTSLQTHFLMFVSVLIQVVLQLLLPGFLLYDMYKRKYDSRREWVVDILLVTLVLLFIFLTSRWDWFSYYLRLLLIPLLGLVSYASYRCIDRAKPEDRPPLSNRKWVDYGIKVAVIIGAFILNVDAIRGYFAPQGTIDLAYPLKNGVYYVGGGGNSRWINAHNSAPPQDYALDIVRLNSFGNRAKGIVPENLSQYTIYEDKVFSPCNGIISQRVDELPDQNPTERDSEQPAGNYVVISCKGVEVLLAHLKQESVLVEKGEVVQEGQLLAQVGNSGFSSQPHLHIHAERDEDPDDEILDGEAVPIRFKGRFLVRNSLFTSH